MLEASLTDLTSAKNPEYKYHIKNVGPGREIVIDNRTCKTDFFSSTSANQYNIDYKDTRHIPAEIHEDFKRRKDEPARSLADFKPANPNIIVRDLDELFDKADDGLAAFRKQYPSAWGYVGHTHPAIPRTASRRLSSSRAVRTASTV